MTANIGAAELDVVPSARGFGRDLERQLNGELPAAGRRAGKKFGGGFTAGFGRIGAGLGLGLGLGKLVKDSVTAEASFSQRMAQIKANVKGATDESIGNLSKLAIQLGQDTVFSANEAADAMLELAKGGFTQAQVAGGGVQATMALAAAEGMGLADAATIVSNNMNAYSIKAKNAVRITDALAAGSAASTASVTSLAEGLSNVGGVSRGFGLDINETVGVLAAFDQNAIKGAEGGTALRSLLTQLAAPTEKAKDALEGLGISLVDGRGRFRDITNIAGQFQDKLGDLDEAERARLSKVIAGAYGQRALNVLVKEGAKGLEKYITSTKQQGKAQELADARMSGTAGAMEKLSGAVETAELKLGQVLAPTVVKVAGFLTDEAIPAVTGLITEFQEGTGAGGDIRDVLEDVVGVGKALVAVFDALPGPVKKYGAELLIAYGAMSKVQSLTGPLTGKLTSFTTGLKDAETRSATLKSGLQGLAGAGGLVLLTGALTEADSQTKTLKATLGGAAAGFAIGGPVGAAAGAITGFATSIAASNEGVEGAQRFLGDYRQALDLTTGKLKQTAEQIVLTQARASDNGENLFKAASLAGISDKQIAQYIMGNKKVRGEVDQTLEIVKRVGVMVPLAAGGAVDAFSILSQTLNGSTVETENGIAAVGGLSQEYRKNANEVKANAREIIALKNAFGGLPKNVVTKFTNSNTLDLTLRDVEKLVDKYDKSPKEVKTLVKASGLTPTNAEMKVLLDRSRTLKGFYAKPKVDPSSIKSANSDILTLLNNLGLAGLGLQNLPGLGGGGGGTTGVGPDNKPAPRLSTSTTTPGTVTVPRTSTPRVTSSPSTVSLEGVRVELLLEGQKVEGIMREIADERVDSATALTGETARAFG